MESPAPLMRPGDLRERSERFTPALVAALDLAGAELPEGAAALLRLPSGFGLHRSAHYPVLSEVVSALAVYGESERAVAAAEVIGDFARAPQRIPEMDSLRTMIRTAYYFAAEAEEQGGSGRAAASERLRAVLVVPAGFRSPPRALTGELLARESVAPGELVKRHLGMSTPTGVARSRLFLLSGLAGIHVQGGSAALPPSAAAREISEVRAALFAVPGFTPNRAGLAAPAAGPRLIEPPALRRLAKPRQAEVAAVLATAPPAPTPESVWLLDTARNIALGDPGTYLVLERTATLLCLWGGLEQAISLARIGGALLQDVQTAEAHVPSAASLRSALHTTLHFAQRAGHEQAAASLRSLIAATAGDPPPSVYLEGVTLSRATVEDARNEDARRRTITLLLLDIGDLCSMRHHGGSPTLSPERVDAEIDRRIAMLGALVAPSAVPPSAPAAPRGRWRRR